MAHSGGTVASRPSPAQTAPPPSDRHSKPRLLVGPYALIWFYRRWLRPHWAQELLALAGVAIAVALVFATIVAGSSISGSSAQAVHAVVGPATLQLHARGPQGMNEGLAERAQRLAGVRAAVPLLEESASLRSRNGNTARVDLAGAGLNLVFMDGLSRTIPRATLSARGIGLSSRTAEELGIPGGALLPPGEEVTLGVRGRSVQVHVSATLGPEAFGALAQTSVAVMRLPEMQRLAGMRGHISRVLVEPRPGRRRAVRAELHRLAGSGAEVAPADQDISLLQQALRPSDQASGLFATISAMLGLLLATAAMLLTAPDRRQAIAQLRLMGMGRTAIVEMVLFQALLLGGAASLLGVLGGFALSATVLHPSSRYLAEAFTLGTQTTVTGTALLFAMIAGLAGTGLASAGSLVDLRRANPLHAIYEQDGSPGNALGRKPRSLLGIGAVLLLTVAAVLLALEPQLALLTSVLLAVATVCAVPFALDGVIGLGRVLAEHRPNFTVLPVAVSALEATTVRSLALAGTGALALFGSIALGGARANLAAGISGFAHSYAADAPIWVTTPQDDQAVTDFAGHGLRSRLSAVPGVGRVAAFQGGFVQLGGRRVWVLARPPGFAGHLLASQTVAGSRASAERHLAGGGWVAVSRQIVEQQHTGLGGTLRLPTPSGQARLRIAALTTNLAWSPGAVLLGGAEYGRLWRTGAPTALAILPQPGASLPVVERRVSATLHGTGLTATTSNELQASIEALAGEGLGQLQEISTLLLIAAILAMTAALTSAIWQRRTAIAGLRLCGVSGGRLRWILLTELVLMLGAGCVTGALTGIYGQAAIDGYLRTVTGFPVSAVATEGRPLAIFALVVAGTVALATVPILAASHVSPALALNES